MRSMVRGEIRNEDARLLDRLDRNRRPTVWGAILEVLLGEGI